MRQRRKRRFFSAAESAEIWDRWRATSGDPESGGEYPVWWRATVPLTGSPGPGSCADSGMQ